MEFIKITNKDRFLINAALLGTDTAELWIGNDPEGPADDDDERVLRERRQAELHPVIGEDGKTRPAGIEAATISRSVEYPGWYEIETSDWSVGVYRFNLHGAANEETPHGTKLDPAVRDLEYSWLGLSDEYLQGLAPAQQFFLSLEKNKKGFCIRVQITPERDIRPAGNGPEWITDWPRLKQATEIFIAEKRNSANPQPR